VHSESQAAGEKSRPDLSVRLGELRLRSPLLSASGTFGFGQEYRALVDYACLGAIVVKGISTTEHAGNRPPRTAETPCGMLNAIGLQNPGVDRFLTQHLPDLLRLGIPAVVNIWGHSEEEYCEVARRLNGSGVAALEVNVSCPNIRAGGLEFGRDPQILRRLLARLSAVTSLPLIVKLPPALHEIAALARAAEDAGAAALTVANTIPAMKIDVRRRRPALGAVTGGLSGPAVHPIAVRLVWMAARAVRIPVVASGGAATTEDVLEFLIAGARAVQIGTAVFTNPKVFHNVYHGLLTYLSQHGFKKLDQIIGSLQLPSADDR